jgi:hypothetical protein
MSEVWIPVCPSTPFVIQGDKCDILSTPVICRTTEESLVSLADQFSENAAWFFLVKNYNQVFRVKKRPQYA